MKTAIANKNIISVGTEAKPDNWTLTENTVYGVTIPVAIAFLSTFAVLWVSSKFVAKEKYAEDKKELYRRIDVTDKEIDNVKITMAGFNSTVSLILAKIEAFTTIVQNIQESQEEKFNRLRSDNFAFQEEIKRKISEVSEVIKITNHGLVTMHDRLDRLRVDKEQEKDA